MSEDTTASGGSEQQPGAGVAVVGTQGAGSPPAPPRRRAQQVRSRRSQPRGRSAPGAPDLRADRGAEPGTDAHPGTDAAPDADAPGERRAGWTPPRRGRRTRRPGAVPTRLAVVLGAVAVLATAAAVVFGLDWAGLHGQAQQAATVKHVSQTFLDDLTNFKPDTVDADFGALKSYATGDFAAQANQFFGSNIREELEQAQAQSEGQVRNLYVQSLAGSSAELYAVVDQTYLNDTITKAGGRPVPDVLRVVLSLTQASGNWKISEVSVLQPPSSSGSSTVPSGG